MIDDIFEKIQVFFPRMEEADKAIKYLRAKIMESEIHFATVNDLIHYSGYRNVSHILARRYTAEELNNWGWTSIDGYSIEYDRPTKSTYLIMPPARKRGIINPNLRQIMEEKYYPLTPPPEPICGTKVKLEVSDELSSYSYRIEPAPIKMPTRDEIAAAIKVYQDYNIDKDAYNFCYVYEGQVTDHTFRQTHVMSRFDHILEDEVRFKMWDKTCREELISAVKKAYENKKKEQEKEKAKMYTNMFYSTEAVDKLYKYATSWEIERAYFGVPHVTIEVPANHLDKLFGLKNDVYKPVNRFDISNIETYNDRVVKVTFSDGSFTKSVCQENDIFDLDVGITVCLMKKMLDTGKGDGTKIYNDIIRNAHKLINDKENEKIEKQLEKEKEKSKARKVAMKKKAKKMKAKEEAIDTQKQAFIRALQETGMVNDGM